jgi:hypothetical protein
MRMVIDFGDQRCSEEYAHRHGQRHADQYRDIEVQRVPTYWYGPESRMLIVAHTHLPIPSLVGSIQKRSA